jgi:hypothetical protein
MFAFLISDRRNEGKNGPQRRSREEENAEKTRNSDLEGEETKAR